MQLNKLVTRIRCSDIGRRMVTGAFWSFTGTATAKLIVLVASIVCARILTKAEYGEFGIIRSTINMFVAVGAAGMGLTAAKYISEYRTKDKEHCGSIYLLTNGFALAMGFLICICLVVFSPMLASTTLNAPYLINDLRLGAVLLFVSILNGAQNGTLAGFENFRSIAFNTLYGSIAEAVFMLLGGWLWGVSGAVLGFGCGFAVLFICNHISIRKLLRQKQIPWHYSSFRKSDLLLLYKFSLPAALSSLVTAPTLWVVRSILVRQNGFEELAIFEAADQWKIIILFIPGAISQVVLPILSNITSTNDEHKFWKILKLNLYLNGGITSILALGISILSPWIMGLYGQDFTNYRTLIFLAASTVFTALASVVGLSIYSRAKMWVSLVFNLCWSIMTIGFSYGFVKHGLGASGIALAFLCSYVIHTSIQLIYLKCSK